MKKLTFLIALGFCGLTSLSMAGESDAIVGTWQLDVARSKFDPGLALQKLESKVTATSDGKYNYKTEWVEANGTPRHLEFTTAMDGKLVPVTGHPAIDSVKYKRVNAKTTVAVFTKDGKFVERETLTLSSDGKTVRGVDTGKYGDKTFTEHVVLVRQ